MSTGQQLIQACDLGKYKETKQLIESGVDIESKDEYGETPIMNAANFGHINIVQLLLNHGADINSKDNHGNTALHFAAYNGKDEVVRLLIERGADLHVKDSSYGYNTPLDDAKKENNPSTAAIISAAIDSTKVIYTLFEDFQHDKVSLKHFNNNIIILSDNDIPDGFEYEGFPTFTLQHVQQCIDQLPPTENNKDDISPDAIHNIVIQRYPAIATRLQHWRMNLLHVIAYFPPILSNDMHEAISSIVTKCPQATTSIDIDGMTPLHHAVINLSQKKISQECHDLLLVHSPSIVVHRAIEAGLDWEYLRPIVMAKLNALTMEDEESGLVPFMLTAKRRTDDHTDDDDGMLGTLNMTYELLCLQPDVLKEYDVSSMTKTKIKRKYEFVQSRCRAKEYE